MELLHFAVTLLFICSGALVIAQNDENGEMPIVMYHINRRNLTLNCSMLQQSTPNKTLSYVWKKNGVSVEQVVELKGRYKLLEGGTVFALDSRATENDFGNYSCALGAKKRSWRLHGRPLVRLPKNSNVVEDQNIKLQCKVVGKPYPTITWVYYKTRGANATETLTKGARGGRVRLQPNNKGVPDSALLLEAAARSDAGIYECRAGTAASATQLRVKDKYAALWPFLSICAEVFVLCAIILVDEKRRTKQVPDDSDADNHGP